MKKSIVYILLCSLLLMVCRMYAQQKNSRTQYNTKIDSLLSVINSVKIDTAYVNALNLLIEEFIIMGSSEQAMKYSIQARQKSEKLNYKKGIANAFNKIGTINLNTGNYDSALESFAKALTIFEEIKYKKGIAISYNNIGVIYWIQGNYEMALNNYLKALKIREEGGDKHGIASSYTNIGIIYENQGNYEMALEKYFKSLKILEEIGSTSGMASLYNNIGIIYTNKANYEMALVNHSKSLKINESAGNKQGMAYSYVNIGNVYENQNNFASALNSYLKALEINEKIGDKLGLAASYSCIGSVYMKQEKLPESYRYLFESMVLFKEIGNTEGIKEVYGSMSDLFEKKGDYKQSYHYYKLFSDFKDTLFNEQSAKQIAEMNTKYDSEKKDKELLRKDIEISKQLTETEKQNFQRNTFIVGFVLVLVLVFFIFKGYRQKKAANGLLEEKNTLIENQKKLMEEKNIKITDSINYAKRIQLAILPSQELIKSFLPDSFIFFRPKDIVSGDFYWFAEKQGKLIIAVADCTGHGVPGAFMSMIGNTLLNEIVNVKNIAEPGQILNRLNKGIVKLLHQDDNDSNTQDDGMDITILSIDKTNTEIEFAGANHFSYIFNKTKLETLKGDVFSIGGMFGSEDINFSSQKIKIEKGHTLYLFTDGFVDQFGGEKNTKFLTGRFEQLLKSVQQFDIVQQQEKVTAAFDNWKGINKQLDDVLVVGICF